MKKILIVVIILLLFLLIGLLIVYLMCKRKNIRKEEILSQEINTFNKRDIDNLNSLNDNVFTEKKKDTKINIPDFDKSKPIGYKDLSHINNTYGDRVAQSNNQNIK